MLCPYCPILANVRLKPWEGWIAAQICAGMCWWCKAEEGGICPAGISKQGKKAVLALTSLCLGKSLATQKGAELKRTLGRNVRCLMIWGQQL